MNDNQLLRYSRQIMLPQVGIEGQQKLLDSRVLIIGLGGLGSPIAMYLASAGVGHLTLVDDDSVELSNLQRQILHTQHDIGKSKVDSAQDTLLALNPDISITTFSTRLDDNALSQQVQQADIILDATDNFATRFKINAACVQNRTPLVSGAAIRTEGQVAVFRPELDDSPCYRCLYKDEGELDETCTENGVLAPLVGIIGSVQAMEAIKILIGLGESLCGKLLILDGMTMEWRTIKLNKDPDCPVCGLLEK
ncbi:MAG: molybdopterin-synthase adenylyltransferase MoeB [Gammaproteobacteria bacterium]|nr:molybdopterin-synthase adenylyltransferase MoeB [Gammaproteobacteria bacterium]MCK5092867.1 molybdopterin-synthase adenylyltransferase MoeB [Gammaproteobacteria bacterium]